MKMNWLLQRRAGFRGQAGLVYGLMLAYACLTASLLSAAEPNVLKDIGYKPGNDLTAYEKERCTLDLHLPGRKSGFATLVWFHGGGLTGGRKDDEFTTKIVRSLVQADIAVVSVNYRLSPKARYPAYIEDAAASFAWTVRNISKHGGDPKKVFISGHSAGGYLATIVSMDASRLKTFGLTLDEIAGAIPISGQMLTHYTIREERGLNKFNVIADDAAPIYHARKDTPPLLVLYADRDMATREEENIYFVSTMKAAGNKTVRGLLVKDRDHGSIASKIAELNDPGREAIVNFINDVSEKRNQPKTAR